MSEQIDLLKSTLTALGIFYTTDETVAGWTSVDIDEAGGDEISFNFKLGKFYDVTVWKP